MSVSIIDAVWFFGWLNQIFKMHNSMKIKPFRIIMLSVFLSLFASNIANTQSLAGTTWDMTIPTISTKPYNFIFGATGNKGNVLMPDSTLADFTWAEDGKGNWSITIERMVNGVQKTETFYGKITGNTGTGFYANTADRKNLKPLTMTKKK
jgi:hypothetical protein